METDAAGRAADWGLDGLLSGDDGVDGGGGDEAAAESGADSYRPRLTLGRRHQGEGKADDDDDDDDAWLSDESDAEEEAEEEEGQEEDANDCTSLWGRVATEIRVRWLLWRNRARYRLRQASAGGGGKRYI